MSRCQLLGGMALASALDAAGGVIAAYMICHLFGVPATRTIALYGALAALSPDISVLLVSLVYTNRSELHHRELTHYPLLALFLCVVFCRFSPFAACVLAACLTIHFVDDTMDPGGIKWLWPFSDRSFQFYATETKPLSREVWLRRYYLRPTLKSCSAVLFSLIALILLAKE